MCDAKDEIEARGARVVVVGNGGAHFARAFIEERNVTVDVFVDPSRRTYDAAGLKRGMGATFSMNVLKNSVRAMKNGHFQGMTKGDPWQQGGVFVLGPGDTEHYAYVSAQAGDHPPVDEVVDAIVGPFEAQTPRAM